MDVKMNVTWQQNGRKMESKVEKNGRKMDPKKT